MVKIVGVDAGTTSVKGIIIDVEGKVLGEPVTTPTKGEIPKYSPKARYSEQEPEDWVRYSLENMAELAKQSDLHAGEDVVVGISAQMHGLNLIDRDGKSVRRGIIWDDTRTGEQQEHIQEKYKKDVGHMTVAKALWVKQNEPKKFKRAKYMLLPEDTIVYALTCVASTTRQGVSQMRAWNFKKNQVDYDLLKGLGIDHLLPDVLPNMAHHGQISDGIAERIGFPKGSRVTARLGDQESSSTGVGAVKKGYVGLTGGTSGVINVITDAKSDMAGNGVFKFLQSNDLGLIIACTFGCGSSYQYARDTFARDLLRDVDKPGKAYALMDTEVAKAPIGAGGLVFLPYGNNGDRSPINDSNIRGALLGIDYNIFSGLEPGIQRAYALRAVLEGIAHSFRHNQEVLAEQGVRFKKVRAAKAGVLASSLFAQMVADNLNVPIEFVDTEGGCYGVALAAAVGAGYFPSIEAACEKTITPKATIDPIMSNRRAMTASYERYKAFYKALAPVHARFATKQRK